MAIERADISPDGSQIIYNRFTGDRPPEIVLISSLGGEEKILAENAILPCWQPDGKRIFFERGLYTPVKSKSGKMEFWSVNANGADEKLEYIDSISTVGRFSLSVSPKGDAIVWQRSFFEDYQFQELCVFNLQTKKEHQLTFDKKNIDEVCWARNDQIIFSSNRNGNSNLWMISALGGTPVQITKGSGPDLGMKISADCKKLLHFQRQTISNIWIGSLRDGSIKQITFDERNRGTPDFSPDGKRIAFGMQDPDPMKSEVNIHIVNRDGSNRKQLTFTKEITAFPKWSPNGKWISFARFGRDILNNTGSYRSYIVEVTRPGTEKFITNGRTLWLNDNEIQTYTEGKSWIVSVETGEKRHFYKDSTQAIPVLKGKYILYRDMRVGGVWIVETKDFKSKVSRLLIPSSSSVLYNPYLNFLIESSSNGKLWKIFLPDGKREKIPHTFHKLIVGSFYSALSIDGNEIVYVDENDRGKLVLIENLFE